MSKPVDIVNYRKRIKIALVKAFGSKCQLCQQTFEPYVYDFHHIHPEEKSFGLAGAITRAKSAYAEEAKKCCMLCANCHRIVENSGQTYDFVADFNEDIYYQTLEELVTENRKSIPPVIIEVKYPTREELKQDIRTMSFCAVGRKYSVTDNAVRKWCKKMNLPSRVTDIKSYSDEEWGKI